jgi:hypothetical protein
VVTALRRGATDTRTGAPSRGVGWERAFIVTTACGIKAHIAHIANTTAHFVLALMLAIYHTASAATIAASPHIRHKPPPMLCPKPGAIPPFIASSSSRTPIWRIRRSSLISNRTAAPAKQSRRQDSHRPTLRFDLLIQRGQTGTVGSLNLLLHGLQRLNRHQVHHFSRSQSRLQQRARRAAKGSLQGRHNLLLR